MAINPYDKFYNPIQPQPLDFNFLLQAKAYKDKKASDLEDDFSKMATAFNSVKAVPQDVEKRNNLVKGYQSELTTAIGLADSGDLISAARKLRDTKRKWEQDYNYGLLGNIDQKGKQLEKNLTEYQKLQVEGKLNGYDDMIKYLAIDKPLQSYQGAAELQPGTGVYNQISWGDITTYPDVSQLSEIFNNWAADKVVSGQLRKDPKYGFVYTDTNTRVNPEEVKAGVINYALSNPKYSRFMKDLSEYLGRDYDTAMPEMKNVKYTEEGIPYLETVDRQGNLSYMRPVSREEYGYSKAYDKLAGIAESIAAREGYDATDRHYYQLPAPRESAGPAQPKLPTPPEAFTLGALQAAIVTPQERELADNPVAAKTYKTNTPDLAVNAFQKAAASLPMFANMTPDSFGVSRSYDKATKKVRYDVGLTENQFVQNMPLNQQALGRTQYRELVSNLQNQAFQEQKAIEIHDRAVEKTRDEILGPNSKNTPMGKYVEAVENYADVSPVIRSELNKQINALREQYLRSAAIVTTYKKDPEGGLSPVSTFSQELYDQKSRELDASLAAGILPDQLKTMLYQDKSKASPSFKPLQKFASDRSNKINKYYNEAYLKDQSRNYNVVTFDITGVTAEKRSPLAQYQQTLKSNFGSKEGKISAGLQTGATFFVPGTFGENIDKVKPGFITGPELFPPNTKLTGVDIQGFIYDREQGFYAKGTLQGEGGTGAGENVFLKTPDMDTKIVQDLVNNPNTGAVNDILKVVFDNIAPNEQNIKSISSTDDPKLVPTFSAMGMKDVYIVEFPDGKVNITFTSDITPNPVNSELPNRLEAADFLSRYMELRRKVLSGAK